MKIDYVGSPTYGEKTHGQAGPKRLPKSALRGSGDHASQQRAAAEEVRRQANLSKGVAGIVVVPGPVDRPYDTLGGVTADTTGVVNFGRALAESLTRSNLERQLAPRPKVDVQRMYEYLRQQAWSMYGPECDAVINVSIRFAQDGNVFAEGQAIRYRVTAPAETKPAAQPETSGTRASEQRFEELQRLLDKGFISREEFETKRKEILDEI